MLQMIIATIMLVAVVATRQTHFGLAATSVENGTMENVEITTSSEAEHKERYECPDCYYERVGWSRLVDPMVSNFP